MRIMKKMCFAVVLLVQVLLLVSCSGDDYLNAIPAKSTALLSLDLQKMQEEGTLPANNNVLESLLQIDHVEESGIDASERIFLFETMDGNLGLCAKVADRDALSTCLSQLAKKHVCSPLTERKGFSFTVLNQVWLVGLSDKALLVMGPVVAEAQPELQRQMVRYLNADEDAGVKSSKLFARLDSIAAPMSMVAQAQALPEKLVAPFTLGAPKDADASQVVVAAKMSVDKGILHMEGETFSFNKSIGQALHKAFATYRPIGKTYLASMSDADLAAIFMNVDGTRFLPQVQNNQSLQTMLLGINTAIDMDNIIRSVDGNMAIVLPTMGTGNTQMKMAAQLKHAHWLADVDYWKKSCPKGGSITDQSKNTYCYSDGKMNFYFGVSSDLQFFAGGNALSAQQAIQKAAHPIDSRVQQMVEGQKMAMVIHIPQAKEGDKDALAVANRLLAPLFGQLHTMVYTMK